MIKGRIVDYMILVAKSPLEMNQKVKEYLDKGWEPIGGPTIIQRMHEGSHEDSQYPDRLYQAIVQRL